MNIYIDIDHTICDYEETDTSTDYTKAVPNFDRIKIVNKLYEKGHRITMWTARGTVTGIDWQKLTETQLTEWDVKHHELKFGKPAFDLFIDDKALTCLEQIVLDKL